VRTELILVDTSIWIASLNREGPSAIKSRLDRLLEENLIATNQMIRLELLAGTRSQEEFNRLKGRLDSLHQLQIGEAEWNQAAELAFRQRRKGKTLPYGDIIIAATAIRNRATLLHADHHFELMTEEAGLVTEDLTALVHP